MNIEANLLCRDQEFKRLVRESIYHTCITFHGLIFRVFDWQEICGGFLWP